MYCICCNKKILPILTNMTEEDMVFKSVTVKSGPEHFLSRRSTTQRAENRCWLDGVVGNISAGYGSNYDGESYVIAICDGCINLKVKDGSIQYVSNYMFGSNPDVLEDIENSKKLFRRNHNLDDLDDLA